MKQQKASIRFIILFLAFLNVTGEKGYSQTAPTSAADTTVQQTYSVAWLQELYEPGVALQGDSLVINKEAERLLNDASYRQTMYPAVYTWEAAGSFIQKQEIKKAIWYLINLYTNDQNKEMVIKAVLVYNKVFKMDKALMSSFYTYSLTDPAIGKITNGHSEIIAPHIMEKKLNALKEMLFYLDKYTPKDRKEEPRKNQ